ncbi:MAG: winged helix-turn-helix domain-containing protein [Chloroflexota bacterium]
MAGERRVRITDVSTLRGLANPIRYRILGHLMATGPQTASECAAVVGASPSNCSYHLRELARFGLVERITGPGPGGDGRDRPWRPAITGYGSGPADEADRESADPAVEVAARHLSHLGVDDSAALAHAAIDEHARLPEAWQRAETLSTYGLRLTADELATVVASVDAVLRPFIGLTRDAAPADAERVHVVFDAFRRPAPLVAP